MGRVKSTFAQKMKLLEMAQFHSQPVDDNENVRVWDEGYDAETVAKEIDERFTRQHMRYVLEQSGITISNREAPVRNQYVQVNEKIERLQAAVGAQYQEFHAFRETQEQRLSALGKPAIEDLKQEAGQLRKAWEELQEELDISKTRQERFDDHARRLAALEKRLEADNGGRLGNRIKRLEARMRGLELQIGESNGT